MTSLELYEKIVSGKEIYSYPFHVTKEEDDYYDCVRRICKAFKEDLDQLNSESISNLNASYSVENKELECPLDLLNDFDKVRNTIEKSIAYLLEGEPSEAFELLKKLLTDSNWHYAELLPQLLVDKEMTCYRIRNGSVNEKGLAMKQKELFHIPFELRHIVPSERYSIPGYPILYVAGSLEMAYREVIKDGGDFTYVKIKGKNDLKFVDVGFPLSDKPYPYELFSLFVFFPLIVACAMPVRYENGVKYKPEYALPQLFTQCVKKYSDFDGICYIPSGLDGHHDVMDLRSRDFAIIVRGGVKKSGYDEKMASKYKMTNPLVFKENDAAYYRRKTQIPYNLRDYGDPRLIEGYQSKFTFLRDRDCNEAFYDIELS